MSKNFDKVPKKKKHRLFLEDLRIDQEILKDSEMKVPGNFLDFRLK